MFVAANKGSYVANAGKSRHLTDAFKYTNAFSFNPFDTVKSGMKAQAVKDIAKTKYDAQKDYYAQTGQAKLDGVSEYNKAAEYAQGQQRMAGVLGALGGLAYAGAKWKYNKDNPLEPPEKRESADNSEYFDSIQDQIATLEESIAANSKITSQKIPSTAELLEQSQSTGGVQSQSSSTSTDTSSTPAAAPGGATSTKPFKFQDFDDLDNQAFSIVSKYESGASGFDAVNQGGTDDGHGIPDWAYSGAFSGMKQHGGRKLTDLSLDEIMELQRDPGKSVMSNQQWADAGKLHAVGAYQFIGPTLKEEVTAMGIDTSQKFTPQLQAQIAKSHAKRVGGLTSSTWRGLVNMTPAEKAIIDQWNARLK